MSGIQLELIENWLTSKYGYTRSEVEALVADYFERDNIEDLIDAYERWNEE